MQPAEASTLTVNGQAAKLLRANIDEQTDTLVVGELLYALPKQSKEEELVFTYGTRGYNPVVLIPAGRATRRRWQNDSWIMRTGTGTVRSTGRSSTGCSRAWIMSRRPRLLSTFSATLV